MSAENAGNMINKSSSAAKQAFFRLKIDCSGDQDMNAYSLNRELAEKLISVRPRMRSIQMEKCLVDVLKKLPLNAVVKDVDVLFNPVYKVDVLKVLISAIWGLRTGESACIPCYVSSGICRTSGDPADPGCPRAVSAIWFRIRGRQGNDANARMRGGKTVQEKTDKICIHCNVNPQKEREKPCTLHVSFGTPEDIDSWMRLVRQVSPEFPGLETEEDQKEHRQTVLKFMEKRQALCVKTREGIAGVLLFSRSRNMICCLAVLTQHRGKGFGSMLLEKALEELDRSRDITVSTFRESDPKGTAPRALYRKYGFTEDKLTVEFGYPNQVFILHGEP